MTGANVYVIKSLLIQNSLEITMLGVLLVLSVYFLKNRKIRHMMVVFCWIPGILFFFNSTLFGFSTVSVTPKGIDLGYGLLSTRNITLPAISKWRIDTGTYGIKKTKRFYSLSIGDRSSMRVCGSKGLGLLRKIGADISRQSEAFMQRKKDSHLH